MNEKEKVVLSVAGGLATVVVGYLVWRHERTIQQQDNAQQQQDIAAQEQANNDQLLQALSTSYFPSGGVDYSSGSASIGTGGAGTVSPAGSSTLEAILKQFFGPDATTAPAQPPIATPQPAQPAPGGSAGAGVPNTPASPVGPAHVFHPGQGFGSGPSHGAYGRPQPIIYNPATPYRIQ